MLLSFSVGIIGVILTGYFVWHLTLVGMCGGPQFRAQVMNGIVSLFYTIPVWVVALFLGWEA